MGARQMLHSGAFSGQCALLLGQDKGVSYVSWNARALIHSVHRTKSAKLGFLTNKVIPAGKVIALQEVHGTSADMQIYFRQFSGSHRYFFSALPDDEARVTAGGVATLFALDACNGVCFEVDELVPGRILIVVARAGEKTVHHINVHNFNISPSQVRSLRDRITTINTSVHNDPINNAIILHGDLNLSAFDESSVVLSSDLPCKPKQAQIDNYKTWLPVLQQLTYLDTGAFSHFHRESNTLSKLDRLYAGAPGWLLQLLQVKGCSIRSPVKMTQQGLSDHAPHVLGFFPFRPKDPSARPIPNFICKTDRWRELHDVFCDAAELDKLPDTNRYHMHKEIILHVSRVVRAELLADAEHVPRATELRLASLARLVLLNDLQTAHALLGRCSLAKSHLYIADGKVAFLDPKAFDLAYSTAKQRNLSDDIAALKEYAAASTHVGADAGADIQKKISRTEQRSRLWRSSARRAVLDAVIVEDREVTEPEAVTTELCMQWRPTFSVLPDLKEMKEAFDQLSEHFPDLSALKGVSPPASDTFALSAARAKPSATGKDMLPYSAWATPAGGKTLYKTFMRTTVGIAPSLEFNDNLTDLHT